MTREEADILIYALGGGMGHMARASALAKELHAAGAGKPTVIATPGSTRLFDSDEFTIKMLFPPDDPSEFRAVIIDELKKSRHKLLVVDALPMGLMGELREYFKRFKGKKALICRLLRQDYREHMNVDEFVMNNYDLVVRCEPLPRNFLRHPNSVTVPPILAKNPSEMLSAEEARRRLGVKKNKFLVLAVSADSMERAEDFFKTVHERVRKVRDGKVELRFASPYGEPSPAAAHTRYYPLMELLPGADLVIGHAGYHLYHECAAAGVAALLNPRPRLHDDQTARMKKSPPSIKAFFSPQEIDNAIRKALKNKKARRIAKQTPSGAKKTAKAIIEMCQVAGL